RRSRGPRRLHPNVLPIPASARSRRRQGLVSGLRRGDARRSQFRSEYSWPSEFQIDYAVGGNNAVFVFHVLARAKIDSSTGVFNQEPAGRNVPKADSLLNVSVETSTGDVSKVERRAAEHSAFAHAMNHLLEQREICVDCLLGFRESDRDN